MRIDKTIKVGGMSCVRCSAAVENAISSLDGVVSVSVSYTNGRAEVGFDSERLSLKDIERAIKKAGYEVLLDANAARKREFRRNIFFFCFSLFFSLPFFIMMGFMLAGRHISFMHNGLLQLIFALPVQFVAGWRFYRGAYHSLKNKSPSMDLLVALGTSASFAYSVYSLIIGGDTFYFESSAMIITLVLLGKTLESRAKSKTGEAIEALMDLAPKTACVIRDGEAREIPASEIVKGDIILVRAGEALAADGIVTEGNAHIDESMLTGESLPVFKQSGEKVFGGTVNRSTPFYFRAEGVGSETLLAGIIRTVEKAQGSKAQIQNTADKVSAVFVPAVTVISLITFICTALITKSISDALDNAVAVLVIACPCSLGLATPTALTVGIGRGASMGILIKNADSLEQACKIKAIALDKTGTLTEGKPSVTEIIELTAGAKEFLPYIAAAEAISEHPIGEAIATLSTVRGIEVSDYETVVGRGIRACADGNSLIIGKPEWVEEETKEKLDSSVYELYRGGNTVTVAAVNKKAVLAIAISDKLREDSAASVSRLKAMGIKVFILTGDNAQSAQSVCDSVGACGFRAGLLPEDKLKEIEKLKSDYGITAMVGDGINDSPALAFADIGFAVGSGTDIALESGDIVLAGSGINSVADAIALSRAAMRKIKQNLFWAFFYNTVGIPLAALGLLNPIIAGAAMAFSSVSVVTNSLLLKRVRL
ncbi:MAG: heavy metal translocating P-type ATPase [Clostridia bacterium]|nr:heavy metal translocating P-type ATPase [Clostridia bacterium]